MRRKSSCEHSLSVYTAHSSPPDTVPPSISATVSVCVILPLLIISSIIMKSDRHQLILMSSLLLLIVSHFPISVMGLFLPWSWDNITQIGNRYADSHNPNSPSSSASTWRRNRGDPTFLDTLNDLNRRMAQDDASIQQSDRSQKESAKRKRFFELHSLSEESGARCNEGSTAGYYVRESENVNNTDWIIFLEGGWYCFNEETCLRRSYAQFNMVSSKGWHKWRELSGILSRNQLTNPNYWMYNMVYIPYCSSDLWSGNTDAASERGLHFHGVRIIDAVVDSLLQNKRFFHANKVILAGSSAGGIGVLLNIDRIRRRIRRKSRRYAQVSGLVDSAWFLDTLPYREDISCKNILECPPMVAVRKGIKFWNSQIPRRCRRLYAKDGEEWRCFMAYVLSKHVRTPVFYVQSLLDNAQLQMSKSQLTTPGNNTKLAYINQLAWTMVHTLQQEKGVFAVTCPDHETLTRNDWTNNRIETHSLSQSLRCWDSWISEEHVDRKQLQRQVHRMRRHGYGRQFSKRDVNTAPLFLDQHVMERRDVLAKCCHKIDVCQNVFPSSNSRTPRSCKNSMPPAAYSSSSSVLQPASSSVETFEFLSRGSTNSRQHQNEQWYQRDDPHAVVSPYLHSSQLSTSTLCSHQTVPLISMCNPSCSNSMWHPVYGHRVSYIDILELHGADVHSIAASHRMSVAQLRALPTLKQLQLLYCDPREC